MLKGTLMTSNQLRIVFTFAVSILSSVALAEDGVSDRKIVFGQVAALSGPAQDLGQHAPRHLGSVRRRKSSWGRFRLEPSNSGRSTTATNQKGPSKQPRGSSKRTKSSPSLVRWVRPPRRPDSPSPRRRKSPSSVPSPAPISRNPYNRDVVATFVPLLFSGDRGVG